MKTAAFLLVLVAFLSAKAVAQVPQNGKLQLHFMDVGQGDGALLISPEGETVLFDDGVRNDCERVKAYLQQLGVSKITYHIASHYHDDHIGCAVSVLGEFPLEKLAYDRGSHYKLNSDTFKNYTNFLGPLRRTAAPGSSLTLDKTSAVPVKIEFVAMNGNGISTDNENDLSLVCVIRFGQFDAVMGGDLSGVRGGGYTDIETSVAPKVGQIEVYKVDHHGSRYSSNQKWLQTIKPRIAVISCGDNNKHKHPTSECLDRLHATGAVIYWTERGNGVPPREGLDRVGSNIIVEVARGATTFTVTYAGDKVETYQVWNAMGPPLPDGALAEGVGFAWSKKARWYHFANCQYVQSISPQNLVKGSIPPTNMDLHIGCPK